jgi:hypothetical protein
MITEIGAKPNSKTDSYKYCRKVKHMENSHGFCNDFFNSLIELENFNSPHFNSS